MKSEILEEKPKEFVYSKYNEGALLNENDPFHPNHES